MQRLEKLVGYSFRDKTLLVTALTHSSYANEHLKSGEPSNERLEFLGDSILGVIVAEYLYKTMSDMDEGNMTRLRSELVCEQSLAAAAAEIGLGDFMRLGKGEEMGGGRSRPSILADAMEALLAAVYLDGGIARAKGIVDRFILSSLSQKAHGAQRDYKTTLQELVQKKSGQVLRYTVIEETGPDHDKTFVVGVMLNNEICGRGSGRSKKEAEQDAARDMLEKEQP